MDLGFYDFNNFDIDDFSGDLPEQNNQSIQTTSKQIITNIDDVLFNCGNSVNLDELSKTLRQKFSNVKELEYNIDINCILKSIHISTSGSNVYINLDHDVYIS